MDLRTVKSAIGRSVNYAFTVERGGRTLRVPVVAGIGRAHRDPHEEHMMRLFERLHDDGRLGLLVDVGVNIGQTLIKHALVTGGEGRYIGFEPVIQAATYVEEIIRCNGLSHAQIVPVALGAQCRLAPLFLASTTAPDPGASIVDGFRDASFYGASKIVPVWQADDALAALHVQDHGFTVKIDTEGSEMEVVRGMRRTLAELRPTVIMEILPPADFSDAVNRFRLAQAEELKATMRAAGYTMERIEQSNDYLFTPAD